MSIIKKTVMSFVQDGFDKILEDLDRIAHREDWTYVEVRAALVDYPDVQEAWDNWAAEEDR